jgi:4-hydroxybenzoate polyprenyltransferase
MGIVLKAAKVAAIAFGGLAAFFALASALYFVAYSIAGGWGVIALWCAIVFGALWICAALDLSSKNDREEPRP